MMPDQDNFDRLRRLLALKRYEQPPPGYFHRFSQHVILRIKDGEVGEPAGWLQRWFGDSPWLSRVLGSFEARPALGSFAGVSLCALMLTGIFYSAPEASPIMVTGDPLSALDISSAPAGVAFPQRAAFADLSGTNGIFSGRLRDSLFEQVRYPAAHGIDSLGGAYSTVSMRRQLR